MDTEEGEEEEYLEKIRQSEDKIFQAHMIRQEINEVEAKISECSLQIDYLKEKELELSSLIPKYLDHDTMV